MPASYKELLIWQKGVELTKRVYGISRCLPKEERFGLSSQLTRAALSIPSNIAEGQQRHGTKEFVHFLGIALGSMGELETQLIIVQDVYDIPCNMEIDSIAELRKMVYGVLRNLDRH